jgi:hypothetical protein
LINVGIASNALVSVVRVYQGEVGHILGQERRSLENGVSTVKSVLDNL